jgi:hypothetical protein
MKKLQYIILLNIGLMILLTFSAFASNGKGYPQEDIKLTGYLYAYPVGIEGSPYLQEDWQVGDLNLENGRTANNVRIRFSLINNDLIFYNESLKRVFVADRETIKSFIMNPGSKDSLLFIKYWGPEVGFKLKKNDFVHVLYQGKINFMKKYFADIINANDINSRNKVFPQKYYFVNFDNQTVEIKLNYRSIYHLFPSKKKEIKKIISENRIRKASEKNLEILFNIINKTPNF